MKMDILMHAAIMFSVSMIPIKKSRLVWLVLFAVPPLTEAAQLYLPGRTPALNDMIAGWCGIAIAWCFIALWNECYPVFRNYYRVKAHIRKEARRYGYDKRRKGL